MPALPPVVLLGVPPLDALGPGVSGDSAVQASIKVAIVSS
jgi:hypothetical protein